MQSICGSLPLALLYLFRSNEYIDIICEARDHVDIKILLLPCGNTYASICSLSFSYIFFHSFQGAASYKSYWSIVMRKIDDLKREKWEWIQHGCNDIALHRQFREMNTKINEKYRNSLRSRNRLKQNNSWIFSLTNFFICMDVSSRSLSIMASNCHLLLACAPLLPVASVYLSIF